jgi:hypothetical protein
VDAPNDTPDINFVLREGGSISGLVTVDPTGDPLERVRIRIYDSSGNDLGSDRSDSAGSYTVGCLPTGDYYVRTQNSKGYLDEWYQDAVSEEGDLPPVHVDAPNDTPDINFALERGGSISGQIVDLSGEPIEGIEIGVYDSNGNSMSRYDWSDSEGHYTVNTLPSGDYYVRAQNDQGYLGEWYQDADPGEGDPPLVYVEAPHRTPDINFALEEGGSISGQVTDSTGVPIQEIEIEVYDSTGNSIGYTWPDSEGQYTVNGLSTGDYYVRTWSYFQSYLGEWYQDADPGEGDPPPVYVEAPNDTPDINFVLKTGGSVSGTITCEDCSEGQIISFALTEELAPDFSNLMDELISLGYLAVQAEPSPYTLIGLPYDTQVWIYAWWSNQFNFPPEPGDYFGSYEGNPIILTEANPDLTEIDIHLKEVCESDDDCDDDGIGCTDETCDAGTCVSTPNDANCPDDGAFCNGTEFCDLALDCSSTGDPCPGECDVENDVCIGGIPVSIDIKPGSCPNPVNLRSKGVLPAAILGTDVLDVTTIDLDTIRLTREGIESGVPPIRYSYDDVGTPFEGELCDCHDLNGDGYMDLTLKFSSRDLVDELDLEEVASRETIPLTVVGETYDGAPIRGEDCIWLINQPKGR